MTVGFLPMTDGQAGGHTQTGLKVLTGVGAILSAAHHSKDGVLHGHTWEVTAWWAGKPDATAKQAELVRFLSFFDHSLLAESVAWAEDLGSIIAADLGCVRVDIRRPLERIYAEISIEGKSA